MSSICQILHISELLVDIICFDNLVLRLGSLCRLVVVTDRILTVEVEILSVDLLFAEAFIVSDGRIACSQVNRNVGEHLVVILSLDFE